MPISINQKGYPGFTEPQLEALEQILNAEVQASVSEDAAVYASRWGIVSHPTLDQTARINQMIADLSAIDFGGQIIFPDGDVCYTGPIDWSGCGRPGRFYYVSSDMWVKPPELVSRGGTNFRMLNPRTSGALGMYWGINAAQIARNLKRIFYPRFTNISWYGPGNSLFSSALAADVAANATTVMLTTSGAVAGDALLLADGKRSHWATIESVAGDGVTLTLRASQAIYGAWTTAATVASVWKQNRLIQFGGIAGGSLVTQQVVFDKCQFHESFQGACFDDTTGIDFIQPQIKGVVHAINQGYNFDVVNIWSPYIGSDRPPLTNCSVTNGSKVVTSADAGGVRVGEKVWEAPAADGTLTLPEHCYIESISGNNITLTHPYTGTTGSGKTLYPGCGILNVGGRGAASWAPANGNALSNMTNVKVWGLLSGRIDRIFDIADTIGNGYSIDGAYVESSQRVGTAGRLGATGSFGPAEIKNVWVQNANVCTGPAVEDFLGAGGKWDLHIFGSGTPVFPMFQAPSRSNLRLKLRHGWQWANASTASRGNSGIAAAPTLIFGTADEQCYVLTGREFDFGLNDYSQLTGAFITKTHSGGNLNFNWPGHSGLDLTLTGNVGAGSIVNGVPAKGYAFRVIMTQGGAGGFTAAFPSYWVKSDGTAIGTIAGGAAGTVCMMDFVSTGTKFMMIGGNAAFV